ncbi:MAG TPA: hemolysin family protein [Telluria sp.]|nr:hemolysin family protein [Telluria sp.]
MEIAILFGLILLNGIFAMSEIALMTARRVRLQKLAEAGDKAALAAVQLGEDPNKFLSTVQIGITSIGILNGIVGEATLARPFALWLQSIGTAQQPSEFVATVFVVVTITYFSIVLGELVPKRLGQINPEPLARLVARPMMLLATAARPFVMLLSASTQLVLRIFGVRISGSQAMTEEDLHLLLEEGSESGIIEHHEHQMVRNVFRLDDRQIGSFMVPRGEVVCFDASDDIDTNLMRFESSPHSRYPVLSGGWSTILGVIDARQMLAQKLRGEALTLTDNLQPPVFVPESLTGMELLENFRSSGVQIAFIVDEYGEVQGIVTLQDVMEAITGEIKTTRAEDSWAVQRADGSWLLDGLIPIPELKDRLGLLQVPEEERGRYNTLSGMLLLLFGNIPHTGDRCTWAGWEFEVIDLDGLRIDKVLATRLPLAATDDND